MAVVVMIQGFSTGAPGCHLQASRNADWVGALARDDGGGFWRSGFAFPLLTVFLGRTSQMSTIVGQVRMLAVACALAAAPMAAQAGCATGAAVGGVAGHVAGHHAVLGAAAGCAIGHHEAAVKAKKQAAAQQQANQPHQ